MLTEQSVIHVTITRLIYSINVIQYIDILGLHVIELM